MGRLTSALGQATHCFREQVDLFLQQEEGEAGAHAVVGDGERADDDRLLQMRSRGGRKSLRPALAQGERQFLAVPVGYGKGDEGGGTVGFKRGVVRLGMVRRACLRRWVSCAVRSQILFSPKSVK